MVNSHLHDIISASGLTQAEQGQILSQSAKLGGVVIPAAFDEAAHLLVRSAIKESLIYGFRWAMVAGIILSFGAALVSLVTIHNPPRRNAPNSNDDPA